nr:unnamed protein product [Digitaria exilis]
MSHGELIKSCRWIVGGHTWEIHLRPKDHWAGRHRSVTLKLVHLSEPRGGGGNVKAKLGCRLVDPAGKLDRPSEEKTVAHKFHRPGDYSGPAVLTSREELEASGHLVDDSYTVQCTIAVLREAPPPPEAEVVADDRRPEAGLPSPDLLRDLRELLREGTGADVKFRVSGKSFAAHKAILASRSPIFRAELFAYTDTVPELDTYGLERLELICEWKLSDGITVGTAATTLALAEQLGCSQLKAKCVEFIAGYLDAVLETEG